MARKRKLLRSEWPRVYWTPKRGRLRLVVDSRKTGFAAGRREFWDSEAEALASAELIARQKDNEGASSFAELEPAQRRDAAEALALLNDSGTLLDAARVFIRERERQAHLAHVPNVDEAINAYITAKRAEETRGEISRLTLYEIESKMRIVRTAFVELKVPAVAVAAVQPFRRELPHRTKRKANTRTTLSQLLNHCQTER